jgi:hypothetical protein
LKNNSFLFTTPLSYMHVIFVGQEIGHLDDAEIYIVLWVDGDSLWEVCMNMMITGIQILLISIMQTQTQYTNDFSCCWSWTTWAVLNMRLIVLCLFRFCNYVNGELYTHKVLVVYFMSFFFETWETVHLDVQHQM